MSAVPTLSIPPQYGVLIRHLKSYNSSSSSKIFLIESMVKL